MFLTEYRPYLQTDVGGNNIRIVVGWWDGGDGNNVRLNVRDFGLGFRYKITVTSN